MTIPVYSEGARRIYIAGNHTYFAYMAYSLIHVTALYIV